MAVHSITSLVNDVSAHLQPRERFGSFSCSFGSFGFTWLVSLSSISLLAV